jgi:hypothetical protein
MRPSIFRSTPRQARLATWLGFAAAAALLFVPRAGYASKVRALALEDLVAESGAIVLGSVSAIDEDAGMKSGVPLTRVTLDVERVLHGRVTTPLVSLLFRVGYLADGSIVRRSDTPQLSTGDRYVLFLSSSYTTSPIVPAQNALLRIVSFPERSIVVDELGHALVASASHGLVRLGPVAASVQSRHVEQLRAQQSETDGGLEVAPHDVVLGDVQYASDVEAVLALIADVIAAVDPVAAPVPAAPGLTQPPSTQLPLVPGGTTH